MKTALNATRTLTVVFFMLTTLFWAPVITVNLAHAQGEVALEQVVPVDQTPVTVFVRDDCQHCQDEKTFFANLQTQRDDFKLIYIDIYSDAGRELFKQVAELEGLAQSTPITLLGNTVIQGFDKPETTGKRFIQLLDQSVGKETLTLEAYLARGGVEGGVETVAEGVCAPDAAECVIADSGFLVSIPFFGEVDVKKYSLPVMSMILGFVDGFNPCAMWVLVTFLIVLLQVGNKRKMIEIAGLFIIAEAIMYYLILNVWFTAWDFIGLDQIVTPIIGLVAIGGAIFFLYEGFKNDGTCNVTNLKQ